MARLSVSLASPALLLATTSDTTLPYIPSEADLVVMAVGITPRDDLARSSGIKVAARGGIDVDDSYVFTLAFPRVKLTRPFLFRPQLDDQREGCLRYRGVRVVARSHVSSFGTGRLLRIHPRIPSLRNADSAHPTSCSYGLIAPGGVFLVSFFE